MKIKACLAKFIIAAISITTVFAMPLYASDQKPILKLEDAIKSAIVYSNAISINSGQHEALGEQLKLNTNNYYQQHTFYLMKSKNEQQKNIIEDKIANDITSKYNAIIILQKEIKTMSQNIEIKSKELLQMNIKNKSGLSNPLLQESKEIEVINLKANKLAKEEELKNAQHYFKVLTGKDLTSYSLDESINYEVFRIKGSIEGYINSKIDIYKQYDKELAKLKEDNVLVDGDAPPTVASHLAKKNDARADILNLEDIQKNLRQTLISSYSSLISLEEQISTLNLEMDLLDKKLKSSKIYYKAGMMSILEYDKQIILKQEAEISMIKLISIYNNLKDTIEKPWVASM